MKKVLLALMLCSIILVSGCNKKNEPKLPKSIQIYQQLNFTPEQNKQLANIRNEQKKKIDALREDVDAKRKELLETQGKKGLSDEQIRQSQEKYRTAANEMRVKLEEERVAYDKSLMDILDDDQKKIYKKYVDQREKERADRVKEVQRAVKK